MCVERAVAGGTAGVRRAVMTLVFAFIPRLQWCSHSSRDCNRRITSARPLLAIWGLAIRASVAFGEEIRDVGGTRL